MNIPKSHLNTQRTKSREEDELSFWEQHGYSNTAEPCLEDRYSR